VRPRVVYYTSQAYGLLSQEWDNYGLVESSLMDMGWEEPSTYWLVLEVYSGVMDGRRTP